MGNTFRATPQQTRQLLEKMASEQTKLDLGLTPGKDPRTIELELPWPPSANHYQGYRTQLPGAKDMADRYAQLKAATQGKIVDLSVFRELWKWIRSKAFVQSYLTQEAKEYHANVLATVLRERANKGWMSQLKMTCRAFPPDKRKRDLSNLLKMAEDAMAAANVFVDDHQIAEHHLIRESQTVKFGRLVVTLEELI